MTSRRQSKMLTAAEAGWRIGVGDHVVGRLAKQGHLELPRFGRYWVVPQDRLAEVERVVYERRHGERQEGEGDA